MPNIAATEMSFLMDISQFSSAPVWVPILGYWIAFRLYAAGKHGSQRSDVATLGNRFIKRGDSV